MNTTIINIINRAIYITKHDRTKNIDIFCQTHQTICLLSTLTWYFSPEGKKWYTLRWKLVVVLHYNFKSRHVSITGYENSDVRTWWYRRARSIGHLGKLLSRAITYEHYIDIYYFSTRSWQNRIDNLQTYNCLISMDYITSIYHEAKKMHNLLLQTFCLQNLQTHLRIESFCLDLHSE